MYLHWYERLYYKDLHCERQPDLEPSARMLTTALHREEPEVTPWTSTGRKRIRERFRATLAGLLELEVLRVRHKAMVETALGKTEADSEDSTSTNIQQGQHHYWVDKDSFRLKLRRSFSEEAVHEAGKSRGLWSCSSHSSEDLLHHQCLMESSWHHQELHSHMESQSRASSGFCDSNFGDVFTPSDSDDTVSSLSASLASLKYSSFGERECFTGGETLRHRPILLQEHRGVQSHFSDEAIPEDGFRSVADLYPDSHWPDVSDILQPKVVLQPTYRSDLPGHQGMEVYRYPSPLHAVALQSPLYAPHSPQNNRKKNGRHLSGSSTSSSLRPGLARPWKVSEHSCCLAKSTYLSSSLLRKHTNSLGRNMHFEKHKREEIILKRARVQCHSHTASPRDGGMPSRPKRGMHRTSSLHKNKPSFYSFQSTYLQRNKEDVSCTANKLWKGI